jgi:hypothetical protein
MRFLNHGLAVRNIEDLLFIESCGYCNFLGCFEAFDGLSDFEPKHVDLGELEIDLADLVLRKLRWV